MRSRNQDTLASIVTDLLERRSMTGFEIVRTLEIRHRLSTRGREGAIYAALIQLERDGWIVSEKGAGERIWFSLPTLVDAGAPGEDE